MQHSLFPSTFTILNSTPQILLCCSNNGHYDIVYPKSYPVDAAICQGELAVHQAQIMCIMHPEQSQTVNILYLYCNITVLECCMCCFHFYSAFVWTVVHSCSGSWGRRAAGGAGGIQRRRTAIPKQPVHVQWGRRIRYPRRPPSEVFSCFLSLL